tara:strand:+ start:546 stop:1337 length:792 start_codon:yes stop_codon:yes gene_type:complete
MKVLYVTTFNKKLYDQSGKNLIDSFLKHISCGEMLVCYEDIEFCNLNPERILEYNMEKDQYMCNWINNNKHNIPEMYGGIADSNHHIVKQFESKKGQYWANHRASRYFRKIVALNYAINKFSNNYEFIFFVDSDCIFKKNITLEKIESELFGNNESMIYYWSNYRMEIGRGPETGLTGYCKKNNGFKFIKHICDCFESQDFLRFEYWDDGYVIGRLIKENNDSYNFKDLVGDSKERTTRVMEIKTNPLFGYIHHFKNRHQTSV